MTLAVEFHVCLCDSPSVASPAPHTPRAEGRDPELVERYRVSTDGVDTEVEVVFPVGDVGEPVVGVPDGRTEVPTLDERSPACGSLVRRGSTRRDTPGGDGESGGLVTLPSPEQRVLSTPRQSRKRDLVRAGGEGKASSGRSRLAGPGRGPDSTVGTLERRLSDPSKVVVVCRDVPGDRRRLDPDRGWGSGPDLSFRDRLRWLPLRSRLGDRVLPPSSLGGRRGSS